MIALLLGALMAGQAGEAPPQSYVECVKTFAAKLADIDATERPVFTCGRDYFESRPGSSGTTVDMNDAYIEAIDAGAVYRTTVLEPELIAAMETATEDQKMDVRKRLKEVLAAADEADDKLCSLEYDLFVTGTMRTLVAGACQVERSDQLMGALIGLRRTLGE